ncbi:MAG: hypothetical protein JNJ71_02960 [Rubrivivax sp.]|nr:hypothetical protein [Rubrivivax sp.]
MLRILALTTCYCFARFLPTRPVPGERLGIGSLDAKPLPPATFVTGNPARVIKWRTPGASVG